MELSLSPSTIWLAVGAVFLVLEIIGFAGAGLIFAGLAGLSVGYAIQMGWLAEGSSLWQVAWFFILTAVWAALLWKPIKRFTKKPSSGAPMYQNITGTRARALTDMAPGVEATVRWSGTVMRARLEGDLPAKAGDELAVIRIEGNVLMVGLPEEAGER